MCISIIQRAQRNTHGGRIISSNPHLPLAQFRKRLTPSNVTKSHRRPGIRATIIRIGAHRLSSFFPFRETRRSRWRGEIHTYSARIDPLSLGSVGSSFRSCWTGARKKKQSAWAYEKQNNGQLNVVWRWTGRGARGEGVGSRLYPVGGWDEGEEKQIQQVEATAADESGREWPDFYLLISPECTRVFLLVRVRPRLFTHIRSPT